jgi:hypothetical protein
MKKQGELYELSDDQKKRKRQVVLDTMRNRFTPAFFAAFIKLIGPSCQSHFGFRKQSQNTITPAGTIKPAGIIVFPSYTQV